MAGRVELVDGIHRWAVAAELGIEVVPVNIEMQAESSWAWLSGELPGRSSCRVDEACNPVRAQKARNSRSGSPSRRRVRPDSAADA
jgi:hypothetical protein